MNAIKRYIPAPVLDIYRGVKKIPYLKREFQLRDIAIPPITEIIYTEDSSEHWKHLKVEGKNVLDLGCGRWDQPNVKESSPVYFKAKGARKVIGVDAAEQEVNFYKDYFRENIKDDSEFIFQFIQAPSEIASLIRKYDITAIKSDIEGAEIHLFNLGLKELGNVANISIEYHSPLLLRELINVNDTNWHFNVINHSIFTVHPEMGVITLERNK